MPEARHSLRNIGQNNRKAGQDGDVDHHYEMALQVSSAQGRIATAAPVGESVDEVML